MMAVHFVDEAPSNESSPTQSSGGKKSSVRFIDDIPAEPSAASPTRTLNDLVTGRQQEPQTSALGTFGRSLAETGVTIPGVMAGAGVGARLGAGVGSLAGPGGTAVGGFVGGVAGGLAASVLQSMGINSLEEAVDQAFGTNIMETKAAQAKQHWGAEKAGQFAGMVLGPGGALRLPGMTKEGLKHAATGSAVMAGVGGVQRAYEGGNAFDPKEIAFDVASGAFTGASPLGERITAKFQGKPTSSGDRGPELPPRPPEGATPEQKQAWKDKVQEIIEERKSKLKLVETAIRNKETGSLERMGPKHDEARKAETKDTHEQGFVDSGGNFLTRKEAWERAIKTGQIPRDAKPENMKDGLHSGDLRRAGDERFQIPEEAKKTGGKVDDAPKDGTSNTAPKTREEYKKHITALDDRIDTLHAQEADLEARAVDAHAGGDATAGARFDSLLKDTRTELSKAKADVESAHKAMPAVQFKNKLNPTSAELHDLWWRSRNGGHAMDMALKAGIGTPQQRMLWKLMGKNQFIRSVKLELVDKPKLRYQDKHGDWKEDAVGLYTDHQDLVQLSAEATARVFTHELVHAGTASIMSDPTSAIGQRLKSIYDTYKASHGDPGHYGFENEYEFVAEAFSSKKFQKLLSTIESTVPGAKKNQSLWSHFKDLVRKGLNIPEGQRTALDEILDAGQEAMDASKNFKRVQSDSGDYSLSRRQLAARATPIDRPVTLDDTTPPRYLYHGTRTAQKHLVDAEGNLVLHPSHNFGGKTSSVSLTHNQDFALDYASRVRGGGPGAYNFDGTKTIKIHSDALPKGISRESGEEWAFNTDKPIVVPKGKYEIIEHPASKGGLKENPDYTVRDYINDNYSGLEVDMLGDDPRENSIFVDGYMQSAWEEGSKELQDYYGAEEAGAAERKRLQTIIDQRSSGTYKEPSVPWGPEPTARASTAPSEAPPADRTKTDPRDVKDNNEFHEISADIWEKYGENEATKFFEGYVEYQKTWLEPIKETEKFVGINLHNKLANERIIFNDRKDMLDMVPDPAGRERVSVAVDSGDLSMLSDAERKLAENYIAKVEEIGVRAEKAGVIKGLLEDYVTHVVEWKGAPPGAREEFIHELLGTQKRDPSMKGMDPTSRFGKGRYFKTFADLEAHLDAMNERIAAAGKSEFRLQIKTKDIAELYKDYALSMEKAMENKAMIEKLKQVRNVNGELLVREVNKDNPVPPMFEIMNTPQLAGYAVHKDMVPALKFVFDAGPGQLMSALGAISNATKRFNVIGSFFHAKSLLEVLSGAKVPVWTPVKEMSLALVDKITGSEYSGITQAVNQYRKGGAGDNVDRWIREGGLHLDTPEDVSRGILGATGKFADDIIGKYGPKTRILEKSMSTVEKYTLGVFDKFTWDFLHTGGKLMVADHYLDTARQTAAKEGKPFDEAQQRKQIALFINDSFGGLDWYNAATQARTEMGKRIAMAAFNPAGRRGMQAVLFAPDWTISTLRAFSSAFPEHVNPTKWKPGEGIKGMVTPTTKADYARLYQFKTAVTYLTLLNAINMMTAGRPIWENKDKTRIEFPDGTSIQAMKHAMEPIHWLTDPDKTLSNKLGFLPKAAVIGLAGVEYASPTAQKIVPPEVTGNSTIDNGLGRLATIAGTAAPFQVQAAANAPAGEGLKRAAMGTLGFPEYGSTPEQKRADRARREKRLKEQAKRYHQKEREAGREK
jgi:hypothetical protein